MSEFKGSPIFKLRGLRKSPQYSFWNDNYILMHLNVLHRISKVTLKNLPVNYVQILIVVPSLLVFEKASPNNRQITTPHFILTTPCVL